MNNNMYEAQIKNLEKARESRQIEKIKCKCGFCDIEILVYPKNRRKNNFCSKNCSNKFNGKIVGEKRKGIKFSKETKQKMSLAHKGEKSYLWKGGKPKCSDCGKQICYESKYCQKCKGYHRTEEHKNNLGKSMSKVLAGKMPKNIMREGRYGNIQRGYFDINGKKMFFRSKWEANYALYLDFLIKQKQIEKWEYEVDVFIFEKIISGTRTYRPDFKIFNNNSVEYHEVKGYMDSKSKTKLKRMAKYYPEIKLILIDQCYYRDLEKKIGRLLKFF